MHLFLSFSVILLQLHKRTMYVFIYFIFYFLQCQVEFPLSTTEANLLTAFIPTPLKKYE